LWRRHGLIVEVDGYGFHSTRRSFENDHERDLALAAAGFIVMRFTRDQIVKQPELVLVRLTRRLAELEIRDPRAR
jgi:very-short-patch-repair endonuclease